MSEFDKAVKHVETCLFWDFVDGQWLDKLYTPLDRDFFNRLMQGVVEAHEAENVNLHWNIASLEAALEGMHLIRNQERDENAKLREKLCEVWAMACSAMTGNPIPASWGNSVKNELRELGIEVSA